MLLIVVHFADLGLEELPLPHILMLPDVFAGMPGLAGIACADELLVGSTYTWAMGGMDTGTAHTSLFVKCRWDK